MAEQTDKNEARLTIKPCGELGLWIYVDGKLADLIHYSDLLKCGLEEETKELIEEIYDAYKPQLAGGEE